MDKRLGLALVISVVIMFGWWKLFPPPQPAAPPPQQQQQQAQQQQAAAPAAQPTPAPTAAPGQAPAEGQPAGAAPPAAQPGQPARRAPEERVTLDTADATFELSSWGGTLRQVTIKDPKFRQKKDDASTARRLIGTTTADTAPLRTSFPKADVKLPDQVSYTVTRPSPDAVTFRAESDALAVEKRYKLGPRRYRLSLEVVVENKGARPIDESLALHVYGRQDPAKKGGSFLSYATQDIAQMVCLVNDEVQRKDFESLHKESQDFPGNLKWIAADEKFFTLVIVPHPDNQQGQRKCLQRAVDDLTGEVLLTFPTRTIEAGQKTSYPFEVYAGPKYTEELEQVSVGGQDVQLNRIIDVALAVLARPLLFLLKTFHKLTGYWGLAIILLTIFVKLVTFYPTQKTLMSAKKMQKLAPEMAKLRKKFENDRQRMGVETMAMYKRHGVSPFGGCLPSLIQMPIWIALFSTLNYAAELHGAPFLGYIQDLTAKDPYYITPLLMGVVMYFQMRMSPAGPDPQQQKMMAIMMPIMFTGLSLFLPAGLAIYTLTSYLIGILQQLFVNYLDRKHNPPPATEKAKS